VCTVFFLHLGLKKEWEVKERKKRIVIAEGYRILREGLRPLLSSYPEIDLVGEAEDGQAANRCVEKLNPNPKIESLTSVTSLYRMVACVVG